MKGWLVLRVVGFVTGALVGSAWTWAQSFPARPIQLVVGFSAGGGADISARIVATRLAESFGKPVVVENRPGASTIIATQYVAKSPADGYTLLLLPSSTTILSAMRSNLPYNIERDFTPISLLAVGQYVLVTHPSVPAKTAAEVLKLARARPGKLTYGSSGSGSASQFAAELFKSMGKVDVLHVPYKGANEATIATATGEIDIFFASIAPLLPLRDAGRIKALGVTGAKRTPLLPDVPTIAESGLPGYERYAWYGLIAAAGLPSDILARLNEAILKAIGSTEVRGAFVKQGLDAQASTPDQFAAFIRRDMSENGKVISAAGIKGD